MGQTLARSLALCTASLLTACELTDLPPPDAGDGAVLSDAAKSPSADAAVAADSGAGDASAPLDASAAPDAGTLRDASTGLPDAAQTPDAGVSLAAVVRMLHRVTPEDDSYLTQANTNDAAAKSWLGAHWQMFEGFSGGPTAPATSWLGGGLLYFDISAVNTGANPPAEHVLKRKSTGERCYNPWGGNPNPQVSWNLTNQATRQYLIGQMQRALAGGRWSGLWLDDVNLDPGSSCVGPSDEPWYTEFGASWPDTWAGAVTTFVEEIRGAFPDNVLLENAPWFSRGPMRWKDPLVTRQLRTATLANREGGILDDGLTTGTGEWSVKVLFDYVDAVHAAGAGVVWDSFPNNLTQQRYALAAYFIGYTDKDYYGDASARRPTSWPALYDVELGRPLGARTFDGTGRFTREFEAGTVVLDVRAKTGVIPGVP